MNFAKLFHLITVNGEMTYDYFAAVVLPIGVKNYHESFTAILSPLPQ